MVGGAADISSRGLSEKEAVARLKAEGPNTPPRPNGRTYGRITLEILREPMFALLLAAAAIYLVLGDLTEAIVLAVFASTSVLIAVVQEARTERVLESLRDLTSLRALGRETDRRDNTIASAGTRSPLPTITRSPRTTSQRSPLRRVAAHR